MKRAFGLTIAAFGLAIFNFSTVVVQAQFTYTNNPDNTITITGYTGVGGNVTIPTNINGFLVTGIGDWAFYQYGWLLTSITIPNTVTSIGDYAFSGCTSLTNVTLPKTVISIGDGAFSSCWSLISITIPNSVTSIGDQTFGLCTSLTNIDVDTNNSFFSSMDGVLFDKRQTTLIKYPLGDNAGTYTIPNSVTSIRDGAFWGCSSLTSVTIGSGVTNIELSAFSQCLSLTSLYFQGNTLAITGCIFVWVGGFPPFEEDDPVTVYYLPGTLGWSNTFASAPTAVWQPQIQSTATSLGVNRNQFGFNINWASGMAVIVEATTDLAKSSWQPLQTNVLSTGSFSFIDPEGTNYPNRFYRVRSQ
jgi:hypothetical protein